LEEAVRATIFHELRWNYGTAIPHRNFVDHANVKRAMPDQPQVTSVLARLSEALGEAGKARGLPPVERWNPPYCGEIDMRIASDGTWFYMGTPITRPALVRLFSTVLRKDEDRFVLVTPVERVGIAVDDAPFLAVEMAVDGEGANRAVAFRTNLDDLVTVGPAHPIRFARDPSDGIKPYVKVRGNLWALVTRPLALDLVALGEEMEQDGQAILGLWAGGMVFPIASGPELEALA
jgi:hypothetical protein